jgi:hypothetical protein
MVVVVSHSLRPTAWEERWSADAPAIQLEPFESEAGMGSERSDLIPTCDARFCPDTPIAVGNRRHGRRCVRARSLLHAGDPCNPKQPVRGEIRGACSPSNAAMRRWLRDEAPGNGAQPFCFHPSLRSAPFRAICRRLSAGASFGSVPLVRGRFFRTNRPRPWGYRSAFAFGG